MTDWFDVKHWHNLLYVSSCVSRQLSWQLLGFVYSAYKLLHHALLNTGS